MALKTYGILEYDAPARCFAITRAEPHVSLRLKKIFPKIRPTATPPFHFPATPQNCADLEWFMQRYPLAASGPDLGRLASGRQQYTDDVNRLERILLPDYRPAPVALNAGHQARPYQVAGSEVYLATQRLLLGDDMGLGKTLTATLACLNPATLPAVVVVQTHMPKQWKEEGIEKFTNLRVHIIKGTRPYPLPPADVYLMKYSCVAGWVDFYQTGFFKSVVFDEAQELRRCTSDKYRAALALSLSTEYTLAMSGTPIYNYGDEIFNVLDLVKPGCLGTREEFLREWCTSHGMNWRVNDPQALGTFLRESFLFLRRTRAEVGRELPPINKVVHVVDYDEAEVKKSEDLARALARRISIGTFVEVGQAGRELDMLARQTTGVSKARAVAEFVKLLLDSGEPVLLAGWHRDVYAIWLRELADYNPVMYTGSESAAQKDEAKRKFKAGKTNLFIISLRSGIGLDGLQERCKTVVVGELDWSPKVHDQLIARVDRDGQPQQVTVFFPVSEYGSDPVIINVLGLKSSQSHGIIDPLTAPAQQYTDESRIKLLAQQYLDK